MQAPLCFGNFEPKFPLMFTKLIYFKTFLGLLSFLCSWLKIARRDGKWFWGGGWSQILINQVLNFHSFVETWSWSLKVSKFAMKTSWLHCWLITLKGNNLVVIHNFQSSWIHHICKNFIFSKHIWIVGWSLNPMI